MASPVVYARDSDSSLDNRIIVILTGAQTFTLPPAGGKPVCIVCRQNGSSGGTIAAAGSDTIDGSASYGLADNESIELVNNCSNRWFVLSQYTPVASSTTPGRVYIQGSVGTPLDPEPTVPTLDDTQKLNAIFIPPSTASTIGGVEIVGTPVDATAPKVPALTSANAPIDASITTAALVGKTVRVENGLITGFS